MAWSPLQLSPSAGAHLPPLFLSTAFTASSFVVHLTDLTYIWSESLNRAAIVQRSREEATSIDPSEGGQLKIFLEKINLGLSGGKGTTLALTINADPDRPSFVLSISVDLPGSLATLQWPVRLAAAPQSLLTSHLTVPLLQTQHAQIQERASLVDILKDKDHVIQKLMDKLEEQGTDLGQMFPQAAGKAGRKVDRKKAEEKVRGISRFDVDAWQKGFSHELPQDTSKLIGEVFSEQMDASTVVHASSEEQESWWEEIKGLTVHLDSGKISTKGPSKTNKPKPQPTSRNKDETQLEDDAFQTQSTPPATTAAESASTASKIDDSTDEDDEDLDAPSQRSRIPDSFRKSPPPPSPSPKPTKKLGSLGKKKAARKPSPPPITDNNDDEDSTADESKSRKSSPPKVKEASTTPEAVPVPHRPHKKLGGIGRKKASPAPKAEPEAEEELEAQPTSPGKEDEDEGEEAKVPSPSPSPAPPKAKKGRLGRIGGRKKAVTPSASPEPELEPEPTSPSSPPASNAATPKRKLGALGGGNKKSKREDGMKEEENSQRGRGSSQIEEKERTKTPEPRETSLERADRKRDALKRELEEKAKAPVKKKRKF